MGPNLVLNIQPVVEGGNYQIISFTGEMDKAGHNEVKDGLDEAVEAATAKTMIFDFTALKFINSEGIGYLMEIHTHLANKERELVILGVSDHIKDVFQAIGIHEIIPIFEDMNGFLNR